MKVGVLLIAAKPQNAATREWSWQLMFFMEHVMMGQHSKIGAANAN